MKISKIKKLSSGKYKIEFENKESITTYEDILLEENILYKKEIDNDLLNKISIKNDYYKIYVKALKYIMTKIRSEKEINEYLDKQNIDIKDKNSIIKKLKQNNMISDDNFFVAYISDKIRLSNDGPFKIKNELLSHNIDSSKIDLELLKYSEEVRDKLERLINKKLKSNKDSSYIMKQKFINYFINLGYEKQMILDILDNISIDNTELIKKEYEKQYRKLSKKYSDDELKYKIKNNLYRLGYNMDEINKIM